MIDPDTFENLQDEWGRHKYGDKWDTFSWKKKMEMYEKYAEKDPWHKERYGALKKKAENDSSWDDINSAYKGRMNTLNDKAGYNADFDENQNTYDFPCDSRVDCPPYSDCFDKKISEGHLNQIIKESVKKVLNESRGLGAGLSSNEKRKLRNQEWEQYNDNKVQQKKRLLTHINDRNIKKDKDKYFKYHIPLYMEPCAKNFIHLACEYKKAHPEATMEDAYRYAREHNHLPSY